MSLSSDGKTLTIKPASNGTLWGGNTSYIVILPTGCVKDLAGNPLALTGRSFNTITNSLNSSSSISPVKLVFIHHSCDENWLADGDGG